MFPESLDFPNASFDLIVCLDPASPVTDPNLLREVRRLLANGFTGEARLARVTGFADNQRLHPDPKDLRNNRVELILLRQSLPR